MKLVIRKITSVLLWLTVFSSVGFAQDSKILRQNISKTLKHVQMVSNQEASFCSSASLDQLLRNVLTTHELLLTIKNPISYNTMLTMHNQDCAKILNIYHNPKYDQRGINPILVSLVYDVLVNYCVVSENYLEKIPAVNILNCKEAQDGNASAIWNP